MREPHRLQRRGRTEGVTPSEPGQTWSETQVSCDLTHLWNLKTRKAKNPNSEKGQTPVVTRGGAGDVAGRTEGGRPWGVGASCLRPVGPRAGGAESPRHENFLFLCSFFFLFCPASLTDG